MNLRTVPVFLLLGLSLAFGAVSCTQERAPEVEEQAMPDGVETASLSFENDSFDALDAPGETLISGRWGSKEGEFGLISPEGEGIIEGPISFDVDSSGAVYVLDQVNKRVQVFDGAGAYQKSQKIDTLIPDAVMGNQGDIYVFDNLFTTDDASQSMYLYRNDALVSKTPIEKALNPIMALHKAGDGGVFALSDNGQSQRLYRVTRADGPVPPKDQAQRDESYPGLPVGDNSFAVLAGSQSSSEQAVDILDKAGKLKKRIVIRSQFTLFTDQLEADEKGNLYYTAIVARNEGSPAAESKISLLKFTPEGDYVDEINLSLDIYAPARRTFVIHPNGDVYQMQTAKEGVKIVRWRSQ